MVWVYDPESDELKENQEAGFDLSGGSVSSSTPAQTGAVQNPTPTSSGNFTDIGKYLNLNQGQAENLGDKVATGIEDRSNAANQGIAQAEDEFNQRVQEGGAPLTDDQIRDAAQNATQFASNPDNVEKFKKTSAGEYSGPSGFSDLSGYEELVKNVGQASQASERAKTSGGRQELIRDVYKAPEKASQGMLSLDEAILRQTPTAISKVNDKAAQAKDIQDRFTQAQTAATTAATDRRQATQDSAKLLNDLFLGEGGAYDQLKSGVDTRTQQATADAQKARDEALQYLDRDWLEKQGVIYDREPQVYKNGNVSGVVRQDFNPANVKISDAALKQLGISKGQYVSMLNALFNPATTAAAIDPAWQGVNLREYAQPTAGNISRGNVATADESAELAALSQLLGEGVDANYFGTPSGPLDSDMVDFRYNDLMKYLNKPKYLKPKITSG